MYLIRGVGKKIKGSVFTATKIFGVRLFRTRVLCGATCILVALVLLIHQVGRSDKNDHVKSFTKRKQDLTNPKNEAANKRGLQDGALTKSETPVQVAIIFTAKRSGSTLLGEFFNQNRGCFYLFEPLFPFTRYCDTLHRERVAVMERLAHCDFSSIPRKYAEAFAETEHTDERAKCLKHNMCFSNRNMNVLYRYAAACREPNKKIDFKNVYRFVPESNCGYPLNVTLLSSLCSAADLVAYKIIRICDLKEIDRLLRDDSSSALDIGVVHLVRDPRAVLSSRLLLDNDELTTTNLEAEAKRLCEGMSRSVEYAEKKLEHPDKSSHRGGYMRVRYEDLALAPLSNAYKIYRFLNRELPTPVKLWITNSFLSDDKKDKDSGDPYGTVKRGHKSLNAWRTKLSLDNIFMIQKHCELIMNQLGYKAVASAKELKDWNITFS